MALLMCWNNEVANQYARLEIYWWMRNKWSGVVLLVVYLIFLLREILVLEISSREFVIGKNIKL